MKIHIVVALHCLACNESKVAGSNMESIDLSLDSVIETVVNEERVVDKALSSVKDFDSIKNWPSANERVKPIKVSYVKEASVDEAKEITKDDTIENPIIDNEQSFDLIEHDVKESQMPDELILESSINDVHSKALIEKDRAETDYKEALDRLLKQYVSPQGIVDYSGLKGKEAEVDRVLAEMNRLAPILSDKSSVALAYWINLYNIATIKLILNHWPIKSIMNIYNGKPWDEKWIAVKDKKYSLNQIEHDIIRPIFNEPRIHFALVCAASSCPKLNNKIFTASNLHDELTRLTKDFLAGSENEINPQHMKLSKLFEWYAQDFGELTQFINRYSNIKVNSGTKVSYLDYDWSLNGK